MTDNSEKWLSWFYWPLATDHWQLLLFQLFSLLARFHEISSPMVELVLDTGCL